MIDIQPLQTTIRRFVKKARNQWQLFTLAAMVTYGVTALYLWTVHPTPRPFSVKTVTILGNVTFAVAVLLAIAIFFQKNQVFSRRFSHDFFEAMLKETNGDAEKALQEYLAVVFHKLVRFWILAYGIVLVGVLHYWITFWPQYVHFLFIVGLFSLFLNYPRTEFFTEIPYQLQRLKMDYDEHL